MIPKVHIISCTVPSGLFRHPFIVLLVVDSPMPPAVDRLCLNQGPLVLVTAVPLKELMTAKASSWELVAFQPLTVCQSSATNSPKSAKLVPAILALTHTCRGMTLLRLKKPRSVPSLIPFPISSSRSDAPMSYHRRPLLRLARPRLQTLRSLLLARLLLSPLSPRLSLAKVVGDDPNDLAFRGAIAGSHASGILPVSSVAPRRRIRFISHHRPRNLVSHLFSLLLRPSGVRVLHLHHLN